MKRILKDIFVILTKPEKQQCYRLSIADFFISVLDITFLLALVYLVHFYTELAHATGYFNHLIAAVHPVVLLAVFFILFSVKNMAGFAITKQQYRFVYGVASRISRQSLVQYLDGLYQDYVNTDSSVINRTISQQPIEFAQYVLNGMQQLFSQLLLVLMTMLAIIILNPLLFPLLLLLLAPPVLLVVFLIKRKLANSRLHIKKTSEKTIQHLQEALAGFIESKTNGKKDFLRIDTTPCSLG